MTVPMAPTPNASKSDSPLSKGKYLVLSRVSVSKCARPKRLKYPVGGLLRLRLPSERGFFQNGYSGSRASSFSLVAALPQKAQFCDRRPAWLLSLREGSFKNGYSGSHACFSHVCRAAPKRAFSASWEVCSDSVSWSGQCFSANVD